MKKCKGRGYAAGYLRSILFFLLIVNAAPFFMVTSTLAQWTSIGSTHSTYSLAADPVTPGIIYAGNSSGQVYKSTDYGKNWSIYNVGKQQTPVYGLAVDPGNTQNIFAGYYQGQFGIWESTTGGVNWSWDMGGYAVVKCLAIDPQNSQNVYAGAAEIFQGSGNPIGVYVSNNGGYEWSIGPTLHAGINALAVDPVNSQNVYAGTQAGVCKSTDYGGTWSCTLTNYYVTSLAIDPSNTQNIYAGTGAGVCKSTDGGTTWNWVNGGLADLTVSSLAIGSPDIQPMVLYAGTAGGVFISRNGGSSWNSYNNGLTNVNVRVLAIAPGTPHVIYAGTDGGVFKANVTTVPSAPTGVQASAGDGAASVGFYPPAWNGGSPITSFEAVSSPGGNVAYSGLTPVGVGGLTNGVAYTFTVRAANQLGFGPFSSPSNSVTPFKTPPGKPGAPTGVLAIPGIESASVSFSPPASDGGSPITDYTVTSEPGGITASGPTSPITVAGLTNLTAYTFTVTATNDVGTGPASVPSNQISPGTLAWVLVSPANWKVYSLVLDPANSQTIYASVGTVTGQQTGPQTSNIGIAKSSDGCTSWSGNMDLWSDSSYFQFSSIAPLVINPLQPNTLYFATSGCYDGINSCSGSIERSTTGGTDWKGLFGIYGINSITSLTIDPIDQHTIYFVTNIGGVYKSTDGGYTFKQLSMFPDTWIYSLAIDPIDSQNIYVASNSGVFKSADGGASWNQAKVGLPDPHITALAIDPTASQNIYAGTSGYGDGVYKSTDGGSSWIQRNSGMSNADIQALAVDPINPQNIYASSGGWSGDSTCLFSSTDGGTSWRIFGGFAANCLVVDPENPETIYACTGAGIYKTFGTRYAVPSAPTVVTAIAGNAQATVSFTAPAEKGGSAITSYTVISSPGGITQSGSASPIMIKALTNGTAYTFTVTATNAVGTGAASSPSNSVAPVGPPGAPTGATAKTGNAQASVSFTAPASNGGGPITSYTVTSAPGRFTGTGTVSPITVTGLTNGAAYTFRVTATNAAGTGPASAASNCVTPATAPGAPTAVTATRGNAQATVSFTKPASNGGSGISSYTVTSSPGGITRTGGGTTMIITGLTNGTSYTFTVTATNAVGTGPASAPSNSVIPATAPGAPTGVSATAGAGQARVAFTAPASNGGAAITLYTATSIPGGKSGTATASPVIVTGLKTGASYTFTVKARNSVGQGAASAASNPIVAR